MKTTLNKDYNQMHIPIQVDNAKLNEFFDNIDNLNLNQINFNNPNFKYTIFTRDLNNDTILHRIINNSLNEKQLIKKIKLIPDVIKLINMVDNNGRTPLHLLCINQYYETYNVIMDLIENKNNDNNDVNNIINEINNINENEEIFLLRNMRGGNNENFNYYILDKFNRLPSSYLCEGINLTQLGKSLNDLKIYNIKKKLITTGERPNDYSDNEVIIKNEYAKNIFLFIKLLVNDRHNIKINKYTDDYHKQFTLLNNEYIQYYRNNNFYNKIKGIMDNEDIKDVPKLKHSKINNMIEEEYNNKIVNNKLIYDCNNYWYLISNYIFNKITNNNNKYQEYINGLQIEYKNIIELIFKLKIQSILDKTNSNILCKDFPDFFNKLLSENYYLPFLYFIINFDNVNNVNNVNNVDNVDILLNLIKNIITYKNNIILELNNNLNNDFMNNLDNFDNQYSFMLQDILNSFFNILTDDNKLRQSYENYNNIRISQPIKIKYLKFLLLIILKNILQNNVQNLNTFYNNFLKFINEKYDVLKTIKDKLKKINEEFKEEDIEYYYDINKTTIHNTIINRNI